MYNVLHGGQLLYIRHLLVTLQTVIDYLFSISGTGGVCGFLFHFAFQYLCTHEDLICESLEK